MDTLLANGEKTVASYKYADVKWLFIKKGECNLTVTNERLIDVSETKKSYTRNDIELDNIEGINVSLGNESILKLFFQYMLLSMLLYVLFRLLMPVATSNIIVVINNAIHIAIFVMFLFRWYLANNSATLDITVLTKSSAKEVIGVTATGGKPLRKVWRRVDRYVGMDIVRNIIAQVGENCNITIDADIEQETAEIGK